MKGEVKVKKVFPVICVLVLALSIAGCGKDQDKVSLGSLSYVPPQSWEDQSDSERGHFYDNSQDYFMANLLVNEVDKNDFLYAKQAEEEVKGYIQYLKTEEPTYRGDLSESPAKVDGHKGTAITYSMDYSKSKYPEEHNWGITYFTEVIVPLDDRVYYFTMEEVNQGENKELFNDFMKSVEIHR